MLPEFNYGDCKSCSKKHTLLYRKQCFDCIMKTLKEILYLLNKAIRENGRTNIVFKSELESIRYKLKELV